MKKAQKKTAPEKKTSDEAPPVDGNWVSKADFNNDGSSDQDRFNSVMDDDGDSNQIGSE